MKAWGVVLLVLAARATPAAPRLLDERLSIGARQVDLFRLETPDSGAGVPVEYLSGIGATVGYWTALVTASFAIALAVALITKPAFEEGGFLTVLLFGSAVGAL